MNTLPPHQPYRELHTPNQINSLLKWRQMFEGKNQVPLRQGCSLCYGLYVPTTCYFWSPLMQDEND